MAAGFVATWKERLDAWQQRHTPLAFTVGVVKKFGDDRAGRQAALIAYFGFFSLFPLLLAITTIVSFVVSEQDAAELQDSILAEIPIIGSQLTGGVNALEGSVPALVVGVALAIYAGLRCMLAAQEAMNAVWNVPRMDEPNWFAKRARSLALLGAMGLVFIASTAASQLVPLIPGVAGAARIGGIALALVVNFLLFLIAFYALTVGKPPWRALVPGAAVGAVGYLLLQEVGRWYVDRTVKGAVDTYGTFAVVIGLLSWLYLVAQLFVFCAEVNVVAHRGLWPRSLFTSAATPADREALAGAAAAQQRLGDQRIEVTFETEAGEPPPAD